MTDPIKTWIAGRGLGRVERILRLKGDVELGAEAIGTPALCAIGSSVYLVAARDAETGTAIDLLSRDDVRFKRGRLNDTLLVGERELLVPTGRGDDAKNLIALARLRKDSGRAPLEPCESHHIESPTEVERAFLAGLLQEGEILLAFLDTAHTLSVASAILGTSEQRAIFVLTSQRALLIALSPLGDSVVIPLDGPMRIEPGFGRARVAMDVQEWPTTLGNAGLYTEIEPAVVMNEADRLLEIARLNWLARSSKGAIAFARRLLDIATRAGDGRARAAGFLVSSELSEPEAARPDPVSALDELGDAPAGTLAELWVGWELSPESGRELLSRLRTSGKRAEPWALELHAAVHAHEHAAFGDDVRARADIELAAHMIEAGEHQRGQSILKARLASLPSEALEDLLPARDADLTAGAGGQTLRIRAHELLARAAAGAGQDDLGPRAELARLQPLVTARIRALIDARDEELARRARHVLALLEPGGLSAAREAPVPEIGKALTDDLLFGLVRHPLAREGGALLGKLQTLLASVPIPDQRVLSDYVERLDPNADGAASDALARAARTFGVKRLGAYVSRGRKGVGLRSYEGPEPFVLLGGRHLEPDGGFGMTPGELAFALGAEVAHLRFGHSRVTSSEVWAGALEKGKQGLDLALGVLPLLRGLKVARQVHQAVQRVPMDAIRRVLGTAQKLQRGVKSKLGPRAPQPDEARAQVLSALNEDVVAAHRVMQLTADRAGLLLSGDLTAAVRAIMLVRGDYQEELAVAEREGIDVVLARRNAEGKMLHQDLAVRVAALLSFYLSDDWLRLRNAVQARA